MRPLPFFAKPSHKPVILIQVAAGFFEMALGFLFNLFGAEIIFMFFGLNLVLIGLSEFVPVNRLIFAIIMRISAVTCLAIGVIFALLFYLNSMI